MKKINYKKENKQSLSEKQDQTESDYVILEQLSQSLL